MLKIGLITENSQAAKNEMICKILEETVTPMGHIVYNFGMYSPEDEHSLTYVQNGILAATLLNSGAVDFIVTGCGTGEGACLACNAFPGVLCGHIETPLDAYLFSQVNDGNCVAIPFAENFGWGGELNLKYIFEKLFAQTGGGGYPPERAVPERNNKLILDQVKTVTHRNMGDILRELDRDLVKGALAGEEFSKHFYNCCYNKDVLSAVKEIMG
ncbi:MAG: RpiB/LacA/LacB family sugar-phosphate isomerase [Lachnospiraceae bacterium]|nr:RpiB/LacA/LacB family sugar-phosphate isomerase [Lachnospiraceae bacterium]